MALLYMCCNLVTNQSAYCYVQDKLSTTRTHFGTHQNNRKFDIDGGLPS